MFEIYFMRGLSWPGEVLSLAGLHDELVWPTAWQLMDFLPAAGAEGYLDPDGTTHTLSLGWSGYVVEESLYGVIAAARSTAR